MGLSKNNHFKSMSWGLDQNSLINLFVRDQPWTSQNFLDSPISTEYHKVPNALINCNSFNKDFYKSNVDISSANFVCLIITISNPNYNIE